MTHYLADGSQYLVHVRKFACQPQCREQEEIKNEENDKILSAHEETEVDDNLQVETDDSPEVVQGEREGEYEEERVNTTATDTDEQFQQEHESNEDSEGMMQSTATTELSTAKANVLCGCTHEVMLYLRDSQNRWSLYKERAQLSIDCIRPIFEIMVSVHCNSKSTQTPTTTLNRSSHCKTTHKQDEEEVEDEEIDHNVDQDFDEVVCEGYLCQFPNVSDFPMQMTLSLLFVTKSSAIKSPLFNVVNCHDNNYYHIVEIGLKFFSTNDLQECIEWFQNIPFPYSIRHNIWSINYLNFNYPVDTILCMMQSYIPISQTILLDQVFASGIDKEIFQFWKDHHSRSRLSKIAKSHFVNILDEIAIAVFGHNVTNTRFIDDYSEASSNEDNDELHNWINKCLLSRGKNKYCSDSPLKTSKFIKVKKAKKIHERIVVVGSSAQGLDLPTSDIDCCLLIEDADRYDRDTCITCLEELANFLKDVWLLRPGVSSVKCDLKKHCHNDSKQESSCPRDANASLNKFAGIKENRSFKEWKHEKPNEDDNEKKMDNSDLYYKLKVTTLISAKVPIIKLNDPISNISCDIGILTSDNSRNTTIYLKQLLKSKDQRSIMLLVCIKYWSYQRRINDAYRGFMNSYGFVLLGIKYLQVLQPSLLPVLSSDYNPYDNSFSSMKPLFETLKFDEQENNKMYLTDLLHGFFEYYSYFDFNRGIINVAEIGVAPKVTLTHPYHGDNEKAQYLEKFDDWNSYVNPTHFHPLVIEDPFDKENNVAKNVDHKNLDIIKQEFIRARNMFIEGKHWADICALKIDI